MLPLGDDILEIETLYNRPDLTSIYGIAREVAVLTGAQLKPMPGVEPPRTGDEPVDIRIEDLERCPRYIGRLFRDVRIGESPAWLKARLIGAGMRPISNVVDVTNYVMLALGSPLHAFDYDTLAGGRIVVRRARPGEVLETLDGTERKLDPEDLVIADGERPVAIGGVMGGANTEVGEATTSVLLEAANFEPLTVLRSGERHHMRTESQTRWEKGVDPELAGPAATYASQLLAELADARWAGEGEVRGELPPLPVIAFRPGYTDEVLGLEVPEAEQRDRLHRLGFDVAADWRVQTPSWRARDVRRDIDLVEEVARFRLEDVPATLPLRREMFGRLTHEQRLRRQVEDVLVGAGYYEAYTYSLQPTDPDPHAIELPVPLSQQQRVLRTTLAGGLLDAARHNVDSGNSDVALFEVAHVYLPTGTSIPEERWHLGGIVQGDFFVAKGAVEAICAALHVEPRFERAQPLAAATVGATLQCGWVAQYGPLDLDGEWSAFELDLGAALRRSAGADPLPRRDHVPAAARGLRVRRRRDRAGRRADRRRARGGRRGAARRALPQRLPRRPDPGRARSRSRSRWRSSRRSGRSRTRTASACGRDPRRARARVRRDAPGIAPRASRLDRRGPSAEPRPADPCPRDSPWDTANADRPWNLVQNQVPEVRSGPPASSVGGGSMPHWTSGNLVQNQVAEVTTWPSSAVSARAEQA